MLNVRQLDQPVTTCMGNCYVFTLVSLVMSLMVSCCDVFSHEMSWMRSWTELS